MRQQAISRRGFLRSLSFAGTAALGGNMVRGQRAFAADFAPLAHTVSDAVAAAAATLPPLPYAYNALEPFIDEATMWLHLNRHHATYVANLKAALENYPDYKDADATTLISNINALPEGLRTPVRNNGGGHVNHSIFWTIMSPAGGCEPSGALAQAINATFGTPGYMKSLVNDAALRRFGSGWGWLVMDGKGKLLVTSTANQDSPYMEGLIPLLGIDVWEHAYYLRYQNRRADYLNAWWSIVNWDAVNQRFIDAHI